MAKLWLFNPGHEEALRIPPQQSYTPSRVVGRMMADLAPLMLLPASEGDFVWCPASAEEAEPVLLNHLGEQVQLGQYPSEVLTLSPWALEPHAMQRVAREARALGLSVEVPPLPNRYYEASHRSSSLGMLSYLASEGWDVAPLQPLWLWRGEDAQARLASYLEGLATDVRALMVKHPYTSSGRGVFRRSLPLGEEEWHSILKAINHLGGVSLEPCLARLEDWAVEYYRSAEGRVDYVGLSHFSTSEDGGYEGNCLASDARLMNALVSRLGAGGGERLAQLIEAERHYFEISPLYEGYEGYIGVDWMLYRDEAGEVRLHPCVEINLRATMGLLAHMVHRKHMNASDEGLFVLKVGRPQEIWACYEGHQREERPESPGRAVSLTTPHKASNFYAYAEAIK